MNVYSKTEIRPQLVKWLLGVIMLFSIFTFTGFSKRIEQDFRQAVKTEVSLTKNFKAVKLTLSYKRACGLCSQRPLKTTVNQNFTRLNQVHTQLVKIKLHQLFLQKLHFDNHFHYFRINIPENSDDAPFFAIIIA